jgi:hypothetical protein
MKRARIWCSSAPSSDPQRPLEVHPLSWSWTSLASRLWWWRVLVSQVLSSSLRRTQSVTTASKRR